MFLVYMVLFFVAVGFLFDARRWLKLRKRDYEFADDWGAGARVFYVVAGIMILVMIIANLASYSTQLNDFEKIKKIEKVEQIYLNKANRLTEQFANYLAEMYPEHERDIFKNIGPEKVGIYLVKYPDIKASKTMMALVEKIDILMSDYYKQQLEMQETLWAMRFRVKNPWLFYSFMPELPKELE